MTSLKVNLISKSYDKEQVVNNVTLNVNKGEIVGLLGPNGAGKTTCFNIIAGIIYPDSGNVYWQNQDITRVPMYIRAKYGISYLPQGSSIFRDLSVEDNIMAILEIIYKPENREKILEELLIEFNIAKIRHTLASFISGGERRRLEIAKTIATKPSIILLDEPFSGIDPLSISSIMLLIKKLKDQGIGILITDHNVREALEVIDRGYVIYNGKIVTSGSGHDILQNDTAKSVYFGDMFYS